MFWNYCVGIHTCMYSASTHDVMKSYLTHDLCEARKFVMAILQRKQGLCDSMIYHLTIRIT